MEIRYKYIIILVLKSNYIINYLYILVKKNTKKTHIFKLFIFNTKLKSSYNIFLAIYIIVKNK